MFVQGPFSTTGIFSFDESEPWPLRVTFHNPKSSSICGGSSYGGRVLERKTVSTYVLLQRLSPGGIMGIADRLL